MEIPRRGFLRLVLSAAAVPSISATAQVQTYPTRPVRLISPFPAGGINDLCARLIGQWLSEHLGQSVFVDNRPGAAGNIGTETVVRASPDGYTLLSIDISNAFNATLYKNLNFKFIHDIAPVASLLRVEGVVIVHPSVPAKSIPEFIAYAKANPGTINMGSAGIGSIGHVWGELFKMMAGVNMLHVPYRGGAPLLTGLLAGQVQVVFGPMPTAIEYIRSNKVRPLAVTTATPSNTWPDLPTLGQFLPGYEASAWLGIGAPKNTLPEIVAKLNHEINAGLADLQLKARFAKMGGAVLSGSPADFEKLIADETEKWAKVIKFAGIKPE
jgi:tripartite-type tricarboxylate transporter receptor subunit TctC